LFLNRQMRVQEKEQTRSGAAKSAAASATLESTPSVVPWRTAIREWIDEHDHSWAFIASYLGLAVVLSVFVSLFWLVFMAGAHLLLEVVRHRRPDWSAGRVLAHAAWEVKLDFALVLLALGMAVYVDVMLGVLGIGSAARAAAITRTGVRAASRVAAWERNLRGFLLTIDEMVRVARAVFMIRRGRPAEVPALAAAPSEPWRARWGIGDRIAIVMGTVCILLIFAAPVFTQHSWASVASLLVQELRPFPS
jgi:hypothetical protein